MLVKADFMARWLHTPVTMKTENTWSQRFRGAAQHFVSFHVAHFCLMPAALTYNTAKNNKPHTHSVTLEQVYWRLALWRLSRAGHSVVKQATGKQWAVKPFTWRITSLAVFQTWPKFHSWANECRVTVASLLSHAGHTPCCIVRRCGSNPEVCSLNGNLCQKRTRSSHVSHTQSGVPTWSCDTGFFFYWAHLKALILYFKNTFTRFLVLLLYHSAY